MLCYTILFDQPLKIITYHMGIIILNFLLFISICNLIVFFTPKKLSIVSILILLSIYVLGYFLIYYIFYISNSNWGNPATWAIVKPYIFKPKELISIIPISIYLALFLFFILIFIVIVFVNRLTNSIYLNIQSNYLERNSIRSIMILSFCFLFLLCSGVVLSSDSFSYRMKIAHNLKHDPFMAFFYYKRQSILTQKIGFEKKVEADNYEVNQVGCAKNVILIICDALRSDHMSLYNYKRQTTPFLDSITMNTHSLITPNAFSSSSRSFLGISNILSSDDELSMHNFFLHDVLSKIGYRINFILSGDHMNFYGLKNHYGDHINFYSDGRTMINDFHKSELNPNNDLNILNTLSDLNFADNRSDFFYLHYMTVHQMGSSNHEYQIFGPSEIENVFMRDKKRHINNYDSRVLQLDDYLRQSFSILSGKGYLEDAVVVITSDHGQSLFDYGKGYGHTQSVYYSEINIPLIFLDFRNTEKTSQSTVKIACQNDVAPSVLDLLELTIPQSWKGNSVFSNFPNEPVYAHERSYYSIIDNYKDSLLVQYVWDKNKKKEEIFIIDNYRVIEAVVEKEVKDCLRNNLFRNYYLN